MIGMIATTPKKENIKTGHAKRINGGNLDIPFKDSNRFAFGDICLTFINYVVYYKLRRDDLTEKELCDIADILNCDYDGIFTFRDIGKQV